MERFCCDDLCEQGRDCPVRNQRRIQVLDKPWVGLTDQEYAHEQQKAWNEINVVDGSRTGEYSQVLWRFIEDKLRQKNT
jgi:hypothetical protein